MFPWFHTLLRQNVGTVITPWPRDSVRVSVRKLTITCASLEPRLSPEIPRKNLHTAVPREIPRISIEMNPHREWIGKPQTFTRRNISRNNSPRKASGADVSDWKTAVSSGVFSGLDHVPLLPDREAELLLVARRCQTVIVFSQT